LIALIASMHIVSVLRTTHRLSCAESVRASLGKAPVHDYERPSATACTRIFRVAHASLFCLIAK
jgi:hypothetical protein